jgi:MFS family permease
VNQKPGTSTTDLDDWPSSSTGWSMVVVLTLAYVISFIDRQILSLLIDPIRQDLGLSDSQISWIGPPAFAICFLTFGLYFGWLTDRVRRTRLVIFGIAVWCAMTAACAFADNAVELFLARMGVGLGEAVLTPCALSLISDSFPRARVGKPIGVYSMGVSMGSSLAFLLGGFAITWLEVSGNNPFASLGVTIPWRETFLLVGIPGLLLIPFLFVLREPRRRDLLATTTAKPSLSEVWHYMGKRLGIFVPLFLGKVVVNFVSYAHFWIVPLFDRTWNLPRKVFAPIWGVVLLVCGLTGVNLGGWLADRWYKAGIHDAAMRIVWLSLIVIVPLHALAPLMPTSTLALIFFVPTLIAAGAASSAASTATMLVTPNQYRGQMTSLSLLIASGTGQFLAPTSIATLKDYVFQGATALPYSMSIAVLVVSALGLLAVSLGLKSYRQGLAALEAEVTR